jgi:hypothetical protein
MEAEDRAQSGKMRQQLKQFVARQWMWLATLLLLAIILWFTLV